jgi:uncharacterized protein (DUF433 family)
MSVAVLEREMYAEAAAARLLDISQGTLHYWLEGGERRGRSYRPVLRPEPTGSRVVTWGEFVEASLLRQYRKAHLVPMAELRIFVERLRDELGVPYPLAHAQPYIGEGRRLLLKAQNEAGLDPEFSLVAVATNNVPVLTGPSDAFYKRVDWDAQSAVAWRPQADPNSPVRVIPDVRFGLPSVHGIRTEMIWEQIDAGADFREVAEVYNLPLRDVRWAYSYEVSTRAA